MGRPNAAINSKAHPNNIEMRFSKLPFGEWRYRGQVSIRRKATLLDLQMPLLAA